MVHSIKQIPGNGFIISGSTESYEMGGRDVWVIKTDSEGTEEWKKTFGGSEMDWSESIDLTKDGGYIITGRTSSFGNGDYDVWVIKIDSQGFEEWEKTFGGSDTEFGSTVHSTNDGGYVITGGTESFGNVGWDLWLIKTDSDGIEEWNRTYVGRKDDFGYSIQQTTDGGYIITGRTESFGNGHYDIWLIKTVSEGNTVPIGE